MTAVRWDKVITERVFHPVKGFLGLSNSFAVPILMYHGISNEPESGHPYFWLNTSPKRFAEQMRFLPEIEYSSICFSGLEKMRDGVGLSEKRRALLLTFDDGYLDFYTEVFPVLNELNLSAVAFLPTDYIGQKSRKFMGRECLTWSQVRELHKDGIEFGSHTVTHPQLSNLGRDKIRREVMDSKKSIEDELGNPVESFSYPYAFPETDLEHTKHVKEILLECGYQYCVTTAIGTVDPSKLEFFLKRIPINKHDDMTSFLTKLSGGYDWMHRIQYVKKALFGIRKAGLIE
jgi:peptidoglycan/xylan/chitin deacetylase (PgdA/CDA1 family)